MSEGQTWLYSMLAIAAVSSLSVAGAVVLFLRAETLQRALLLLISFAAGALLGDAFLHIVPEVAEASGFDLTASVSLLSGVVAFFVLEKVLHWHHAHLPHEEVIHPVGVSNLVGDGLHNFIDGAIIAAAFSASPQLGMATAVAVALHEIPQELGDFAILLHAGTAPKRALLLNFVTALAAFAGAAMTLAIVPIETVERFFLPFTAGAFLYIAATDLIPELHKEAEPLKSTVQAGALVLGMGVMGALLPLG